MNRTVLIMLGLAAAGLGYFFIKKKAAIVSPAPPALPAPGEKETSDEARAAATALAEKLKQEYKETFTEKIRSWV